MHAIKLANWLLLNAESLDHLKLQKLSFYAYGAALALDAEGLGLITFHAWRHGPVNTEIYEVYRNNGRSKLSPPDGPSPTYPEATAGILRDVVAVYGRLTSWRLRQESHLETPWRETPQSSEIDQESIKAHFKAKFAPGAVAVPRNLLGAWSFAADGLPTQTWDSLHQLACALTK